MVKRTSRSALSILYSLVIIAGSLAAITWWLGAVAPLLASTPLDPSPHSVGSSPSHDLRVLVRATLILSFTLIASLMAILLFAVFREWVRRPRALRQRQKTEYVDAWKLAGDRLGNADRS